VTLVNAYAESGVDELDCLMERSGGRVLHSTPGILELDMSDNDLKFSNSDISLDDVIERSGGRLLVSSADTLLDAEW
jgi:hypothetical protein